MMVMKVVDERNRSRTVVSEVVVVVVTTVFRIDESTVNARIERISPHA